MSAINTQFSIAVHLMVGLGFREGQGITSSKLASSINTSPSFVRRTLSKLSKAGLVHATIGKSGTCLLGKRVQDISLLDIYKAVSAPKIFSIHEYPIQKICPVSCHIKLSMDKVLNKTQKIWEKGLGQISLAEIITDINRRML